MNPRNHHDPPGIKLYVHLRGGDLLLLRHRETAHINYKFKTVSSGRGDLLEEETSSDS